MSLLEVILKSSPTISQAAKITKDTMEKATRAYLPRPSSLITGPTRRRASIEPTL